MRNEKTTRRTVFDRGSSRGAAWPAGAFGTLRLASPWSSAGTGQPSVAALGKNALVWKKVLILVTRNAFPPVNL